MRTLPTLGQPRRKSPLPRVIALAVVVGLITGGGYLWRQRAAAAAEQAKVAAELAEVQAQEQAREEAERNRPATPEEVLQERGLKVASALISGPLETAIVAAVGPSVGPALTQVVTRSLVWWVEVPGDLRRGDRLEMLYEEPPGQEPLVRAVRFESQKTGRSHQAYLFLGEGEKYPRFFEPSGEELELRLRDSPIDEYEQITSLLRDGRKHKGVDFKAPEGSAVKAPFDGVIVRRNWGFRTNGNSLELQEPGGRRSAIFLHLAEVSKEMAVGVRVKKGQQIARSGNTGRSFAPHLHYQLMGPGGTRVLDPFSEHQTFRRKLSDADRPRFEEALDGYRALLGSAVAGTASP